jgi:hypothetical protein
MSNLKISERENFYFNTGKKFYNNLREDKISHLGENLKIFKSDKYFPIYLLHYQIENINNKVVFPYKRLKSFIDTTGEYAYTSSTLSFFSNFLFNFYDTFKFIKTCPEILTGLNMIVCKNTYKVLATLAFDIKDTNFTDFDSVLYYEDACILINTEILNPEYEKFYKFFQKYVLSNKNVINGFKEVRFVKFDNCIEDVYFPIQHSDLKLNKENLKREFLSHFFNIPISLHQEVTEEDLFVQRANEEILTWSNIENSQTLAPEDVLEIIQPTLSTSEQAVDYLFRNQNSETNIILELEDDVSTQQNEAVENLPF